MSKLTRRYVLKSIAVLPLATIGLTVFGIEPYGPKNAEITMVVTDPLALPLACSCVQGFAQRKYEKLADFLQSKLGKSVRVVWSESLEKAKNEHGLGSKTILIGKDSVIRFDSKKLKMEVTAIAQLTDVAGSVKQKGMFVVRRDDPAASLLDLEGYRVLWGPEKCTEKSASPKSKLKELEIETVGGEVCETCTVAARKLIDETNATKVAGIISSYAERLLIGCGTIEKGTLKIVGESDEVPFISVFLSGQFTIDEKKKVLETLVAVRSSEDLLVSMESKDGFVPYSESSQK